MRTMCRYVQKFSIIILLPVLVLTISCRSADTANDIEVDTGVVYTIGDSYQLTFQDLHAYAQNQGVGHRYDDALEGYVDIMNEMVGNQFKRFDFFDRNLHEKEELLLPMQRYINEELVTAYYNQEFLDTYLTDAALREAYENMQREVIYRQIVLRDDEHNSVEAKADTILQKIEEGEDFSRLVSTYSQHQRSMRTSGYAEPATWSRSVRFPVDSVAFNLYPGEVDVVRHNNAHYIIKATDRNRIQLDPFEEMEEEVKRRVRDAYIQQSVNEYDRFLEELVDEKSAQLKEDNINKVIEWARQPGFFSANLYRDVIKEELEADNNFHIFSYNGGVVDLEKYLFLLDNILRPTDSSSFTREMLKDYMVNALREMKVGELAKEAGLLYEIFTPVTQNRVIRNELLIAYNNHVIESQIPEPSQDKLKDFYEEVKDSLFYQLKTVYTRIITADSESEIEDLKAQYEAGTPFTDLAHRIQVRVFYRDRDGSLHVRHNRPQPDLENIVIELEEGDVIGPVDFLMTDGGTVPALIRANRVLPEKQLDFDEVTDRIEREFRDYHRAKINEKEISNIRENYEARFYEEHLIRNLKDRGLI